MGGSGSERGIEGGVPAIQLVHLLERESLDLWNYEINEDESSDEASAEN